MVLTYSIAEVERVVCEKNYTKLELPIIGPAGSQADLLL